ncbi:MAG: RNA polymerase factor sigma-54 [Azoarcus sp.]|jgi:RNA polymerase sigma-54 factor|nr:RNA polymerase factor sigma-54 [Azoarcus sp.]
MKPTLQLKLSQHLTLTPQLQQSIKLLQLSTLELNQEVERFLQENPMLEREESSEGAFSGPSDTALPPGLTGTATTAESGGSERGDEREPDAFMDGIADEEKVDWSDAGGGARNRGEDEDFDFQEAQAASTSLREHLDAQVALSPLSNRDRMLVRFVIEALDDDGYLRQELEELFELLPPELGFDTDDLMIALRHVQQLDPSGVGARTPQECLGLQLRALPASPERDLALVIVEQYIELLAVRNFNQIRHVTGCENETLRTARALILDLDPYPGSRHSGEETRYVLPDVNVRKIRGRWAAMLNDEAMPKLRVNRLYATLLRQNRGQAGALSGQLQEARWFIKNIRQRFDTILRVSQAIVDQQRQFFDHGEVAMRPLTLREIADRLELHESTVSRVTTQKYMATPRGVLELKYFFSSHVATDVGGAASSTAIRALIRQIIDAEDKKKPLSDAKIVDLLNEQGVVVARRTIVKYRTSLNIPPVNLRKTL